MTGQCRNPGCQRLATVIVHIPMVGDRELCYHCEQALSGMGMDIRRKDAPRPVLRRTNDWPVPA